jgi:hypothetical protein
MHLDLKKLASGPAPTKRPEYCGVGLHPTDARLVEGLRDPLSDELEVSLIVALKPQWYRRLLGSASPSRGMALRVPTRRH